MNLHNATLAFGLVIVAIIIVRGFWSAGAIKSENAPEGYYTGSRPPDDS